MDSLDKLNEIKAKLGNVGPAVMAVSKQKPASAVIPLLEAGRQPKEVLLFSWAEVVGSAWRRIQPPLKV